MASVKSDVILTPEFRVAGPLNVFTTNDNGKYTLRALFKKGEKLSEIKQAIKQVAEEAFRTTKGVALPIHDQGEKDGYDGYEDGALFMNLSSNMRPGLVDPAAQRIMDDEDFYPGCWAHAKIRFYSYEYQGKKGVGVGVDNIQKLRDDEAFSGREKPEDAFDPVEGATTADDVMGDGADEKDPLGVLD